MMRCIAIDDEPLALELLADNIRQVPYLQLVGKFLNTLEATPFMQREPVDLLFLDIQMPGMTGLQFLRSLPQRPIVILITAYERYALDGFELDVVDYLVKPVALDRFVRACNKAFELFQVRTLPAAQASSHPGYIFVNSEYSLVKVNLPDIVWIEGLKDYIRIRLENSQKPIVTRMNMKTLEEQLPAGEFIRVHKSYIVSIRHITAIRKNGIFIGNQELPVGSNYRTGLDALTGRGEL
ncbi:MAG: LytTR family DNA-binding domain-containing protein [Puia sp.]|nr:LytTR family DNA-binding domain-containing protein [Puia sp.]